MNHYKCSGNLVMRFRPYLEVEAENATKAKEEYFHACLEEACISDIENFHCELINEQEVSD